MWEEEARDLVAQGRSLTELAGVGPWVGRIVHELLAPEPLPDAPPTRQGFRSFAECRAIVAADAERAGARGRPRAHAEPLPVRADLQMHTRETDGAVGVAEMADGAAAYGYEHILITDHSKGLVITNGMNEARLRAQRAEIDALNAARARPPRVLQGIEMNLSPAGEGDMEHDALAELDLVLGAFHSKLRVKEDQTERYLAALDNPTIDVLAHPRGRIWNFRLGLSADWRRVAERAAERGIALEVDAYPDRQDLNVELLAHVRAAGGMISIGTDAHTEDELRFLPIGVAAAVSAGIPRARILNCMSADELLRWRRRSR